MSPALLAGHDLHGIRLDVVVEQPLVQLLDAEHRVVGEGGQVLPESFLDRFIEGLLKARLVPREVQGFRGAATRAVLRGLLPATPARYPRTGDLERSCAAPWARWLVFNGQTKVMRDFLGRDAPGLTFDDVAELLGNLRVFISDPAEPDQRWFDAQGAYARVDHEAPNLRLFSAAFFCIRGSNL